MENLGYVNDGIEKNQLLIQAIKYFIKIAEFGKFAQNESNQIPIFHFVSFPIKLKAGSGIHAPFGSRTSRAG